MDKVSNSNAHLIYQAFQIMFFKVTLSDQSLGDIFNCLSALRPHIILEESLIHTQETK